MSHELSFAGNGSAELMLASGKSAWHSFGTILDGIATAEQAMAIACPWQAFKAQLLLPSREIAERTGVQIETNKSERYAILRDDTAATIGYVGEGYEIIQPTDMFSFTEGLKVPGYETAGAIRGGSVLFLCAHVGEINVLGSGDITRTYLTFVNSFDGSIAAQAYLCGVRIVCANTLQASLRSKQGTVLKFKHTKNVHDKIRQAAVIMESQQASQATLQTALETLAKRKLSKQTYVDILADLFPGEATRTQNVKREISALFASNDDNAFPEFKGTAYSLLNAVTDYVDHERGVRVSANSSNSESQQRFESALLGNGAELKARALERILVMSDGSETIEPPFYSMPSVPSSKAIDVQPTIEVSTSKSEAFATAMESMQGDTSILYTTASQKEDYDQTMTMEVVEKISDEVSMRKVLVPQAYVLEQIERYKASKSFVASEKEWKSIQDRRAS